MPNPFSPAVSARYSGWRSPAFGRKAKPAGTKYFVKGGKNHGICTCVAKPSLHPSVPNRPGAPGGHPVLSGSARSAPSSLFFWCWTTPSSKTGQPATSATHCLKAISMRQAPGAHRSSHAAESPNPLYRTAVKKFGMFQNHLELPSRPSAWQQLISAWGVIMSTIRERAAAGTAGTSSLGAGSSPGCCVGYPDGSLESGTGRPPDLLLQPRPPLWTAAL